MTLDDGVPTVSPRCPVTSATAPATCSACCAGNCCCRSRMRCRLHAYVTPLAVRIGAGDAGQALGVRVDPLQRPIDNAPLLTAEALADARRHWQRVTEGPLFVNLVNQVFRLDDERRRYERSASARRTCRIGTARRPPAAPAR